MGDLETIAEMFYGKNPSDLTDIERKIYSILERKGLLTDLDYWTGETIIGKPVDVVRHPY